VKYIQNYFWQVGEVLSHLDNLPILAMIQELEYLKKTGGRLFILGNGGSAANASHAVNDFRKISGIEAYTPTDNVAELTAHANDEGWAGALVNWLSESRMRQGDAVLVLSVGGGARIGTSANIHRALEYASLSKVCILGIVSRDGGYTKEVADVCLVIPTLDYHYITPFAESFQALIWHCIVNHPALSEESIDA
jgi:D-sedoheptulose 7-phosphate isomerase